MKYAFTVWKFTSPTSGESNVVVRSMEPNDLQVQHSYQIVLWRGLAESRAEALNNAKG